MKKQRPPRPKHKRARPAPTVKPKVEVSSLTIETGSLGSSRMSNTPVERPSRQLVEPKKIELADRGVMSNARGWQIFAGFIISWLLLAGAVVLFATHWT
jgi:hypothetical protein